ncbi:ABC-three component system middle component 1 [Mesorhizobium sp. M0589]|uniref:ABC-three component system middle component 1 n=1 Tax=Mesorhizobium sp. M0589 TaxID=2956965 RepID=UPI00333DD391
MNETFALGPLEEFVQRVRGAADRRKLPISEQPQFAGRSFNGGSSAATTLEAGELPAEARALKIGRYAVILGTLPDVPTLPGVRETLRRYRNQCVVARSFLSTNESLDLQLFLVGPRGSEWERKWKSLGLFLERDDRVARKLAWLRPRDAARDGDSFDDFVRRTFLARPWEEDEKELHEDRSLDLEELTPVGLPRSTAEEFDSIALEGDDERPADDIVQALVGAWERRETS